MNSGHNEMQSIRVAVVQSAPWGWTDASGTPRGSIVEGARRLVSHVAPDLPIKFILAPLERVTHLMTTGEADLSYSLNDPRLSEGAVKVANLGDFHMEVWRLPSQSEPQPFTIEELRGAKVGIAIKALQQTNVLEHSQVVALSRPNRLLQIMMAGRIDAVMEFDVLLNYSAAQIGLQRRDFDILQTQALTAFIWMSKKSPLIDARQLWAEAAAAIGADQHFQESTRKSNYRARQQYAATQTSHKLGSALIEN
ncbi:MAG: hypothetical protein AseanaTS_01000 [Candidatus Pelagadaptatus aseana]